MLDFRELRFTFAPNIRVQQQTKTVGFGRVVKRASAALRGVNIGYDPDVDRDMARIVVDINTVRVTESTGEVTVVVATLFRDSSNNDPFEAEVKVLVLADLPDVA
jgi:hypothetical protein